LVPRFFNLEKKPGRFGIWELLFGKFATFDKFKVGSLHVFVNHSKARLEENTGHLISQQFPSSLQPAISSYTSEVLACIPVAALRGRTAWPKAATQP
jgi:hypothetical protein